MMRHDPDGNHANNGQRSDRAGKGHPPVPAGPPRKGRTVLRAGAGGRHLYQRGLGDALLSEDRLQRLP